MSNRVAADRKDVVALVGSDPAFAEETALQLRHFGYRLETVSDPGLVGEAEPLPSAVLLDVQHGAGHAWGDESLRKELAVPVIVVSCRDDMASRLAAVRMGAVAYLLKPIDYALLVDTLDQVTGRRYTEPYRVLLVEKDPLEARSYASVMMDTGMKVTTLVDPMRTLDAMADFNPEIVLMELDLQGVAGIELASVIRQKQTYISVPIVFLSAETRVERQIEAMQQGDNFLSKPIDPIFLASAVSSRAERYRMLRALMTRDSLTGLLNHTNAKERVVTEVSRASRQGTNLVLAMIDVDRFKRVNDTHGHQAGDRVLKRLARLLQQRLRRTDILGRYGGDEFVVVMVDTPLEAASAVLERVREDFSSLAYRTPEARFAVTFSAGVASLEHHGDAGALLEAADQALYAAKRAGGNRVVTVGPSGGRGEKVSMPPVA